LGGLLFGNQRNTGNRTELLILIKPHVLRTAEDARAVTEELRAKLRTLEPFRTKGTLP
jgi:general secretion pathway protein D